MHVYLSININHSFCSLLLFVNTGCKVNKKRKSSTKMWGSHYGFPCDWLFFFQDPVGMLFFFFLN